MAVTKSRFGMLLRVPELRESRNFGNGGHQFGRPLSFHNGVGNLQQPSSKIARSAAQGILNSSRRDRSRDVLTIAE
jgi:hypothetical protein